MVKIKKKEVIEIDINKLYTRKVPRIYTVQAMQYLREKNIGAILDFCKELIFDPKANEYYLKICETNFKLNKTDWIVKNENGTFSLYKNKAFEIAFESIKAVSPYNE